LIKIAAANSPRFDHSYNSATGEIESLGLLIEEARTNLLLRSEDFSTTWSATSSTITVNAETAPNGTVTADLTLNTDTTAGFIQSVTKPASAITYACSLWVKSSVTSFTLVLDGSNFANRGACVYNLASGTFVSASNFGTFTNTSGSIVSYPDDWRRLVLVTTSDTATAVRFRFFFGTTSDTAYIWGAQLEQGAFPTSYIPTTASTVTRTVDNASMTGTNFSSWYNQSEGSIFSIASTIDPSSVFPTLASFNDGTTQNRIQIGRTNVNNAANRCFIEKDSVNQATIIFGSTSQNQLAKLSLGWKQNSVIGTMNNLQSVEDTNALIPTVSRLQLGATTTLTPSFNFLLNGHISQLTYYPTRLPNNILQNLTR
jgi:hypothetical protein